MDWVTATVSAGRTVLVEGVPAYLRPAGRGARRGLFLAPSDAPVEVDGEYHLRADNGEDCAIRVTDRLDGGDDLIGVLFTATATS